MFDLEELKKTCGRHARCEELFEQARSMRAVGDMGCFQLIRKIWDIELPHVVADLKAGNGFDPYFVDWTRWFTPIEWDAWHTIRRLGLPLFPQIPVGRYFVDFGDPVQRIAIECDGREWHDREKDQKRDEALSAQCWKVYRVTGRECHRGGVDWSEHPSKERIQDWLFNSSDGVISSVGRVFYGRGSSRIDIGDAMQNLAKHSYQDGERGAL